MQQSMYVRTTYATGDPAQIEAALEAVGREAPDLLRAQPGFQRFGLFADRDLGKIVIGSWWESASARSESDTKLRERRMQLLSPFATTVTTEEWEAVSYTEAPQIAPGGGMRLGRVEFEPSDASMFVDSFVNTGRPKLEAISGLVGATLFMNAPAGRAVVGTLFRDRAALVASRGPQAAVRGNVAAKSRVSLMSMEEYEVVALARPA